MSKFKVGDKVMLSPESMFVNATSNYADSYNPLNIIGTVADFVTSAVCNVEWCNGNSNYYRDEDLIPIPDAQPKYECLYAVIEELQAHVETLEDALDKVTKELLELREKVDSSTETSFKPIADMTIKDWVLAKEEAWVFEDGIGEFFIVVDIDLADIYPIKCNDEHYYTLDGVWNDNVKGSDYDLKQRIK